MNVLKYISLLIELLGSPHCSIIMIMVILMNPWIKQKVYSSS